MCATQPISSFSQEGHIALNLAVSMGHLDLTLALLAKGAFIDAINEVLI